MLEIRSIPPSARLMHHILRDRAMLFAAAIVFQLRSFVHILGPPPSDGAIITQKKASVFLLSLQYVYFFT